MENKEIIKQINREDKKINVLVDMSNLMYRKIFAMQPQLSANGYTDFRLFKHSVISTIIDFLTNFNKNHTSVVLCYDNKYKGKYWRNKIFEGYKDNRKNVESSIDKEIIHKEFSELEDDLETSLPWLSIREKYIEADDIIGIITETERDSVNVIYSPDKDFVQLQRYDNVYQFDPMKKIFIECEEPDKFLFEHIIKGDSGDGISNIFSDIDCVVTLGKKQKPVRKTKIAEMWHLYKEKGMDAVEKIYFTDKEKTRYEENTKLIDLTSIDKKVKEKIISVFKNTEISGSRKKFWEWCIQNKMNKLSELSMLV